MMSGAFDSDMLLLPRMRIREPAPVMPLLGSTTAPATREVMRSEALVTAAIGTSETSMTPIELPISRCCCSCPVAVATTAPSSSAVGRIVKFTVAIPPPTVNDVSAGAYPRRRARTRCDPIGTWVIV
jgi:hypothetical protein